ncbi:MAG: hypothetical protein ACI3VQ_04330 [Faecousia sp.]
MKKIIIALSVVLATLLGVLIYCICADKTADQPEQRETLPVTTAAESVEEKESEPVTTQKPTETEPATETTREETTELTEETTEATEETTQETTPPVGEAGNSGRFTSDTGTGLELLVDWTTYTDENGTDMVRFDVSIESYSIYVGSRINGLVITMDGRTKKLDSGEITYASGPKKTFLLGSCTMEMLSETAHAEVSWDFFGSYKDTPMDQITASGEVRR